MGFNLSKTDTEQKVKQISSIEVEGLKLTDLSPDVLHRVCNHDLLLFTVQVLYLLSCGDLMNVAATNKILNSVMNEEFWQLACLEKGFSDLTASTWKQNFLYVTNTKVLTTLETNRFVVVPHTEDFETPEITAMMWVKLDTLTRMFLVQNISQKIPGNFTIYFPKQKKFQKILLFIFQGFFKPFF